jgi:hypothetical protein
VLLETENATKLQENGPEDEYVDLKHVGKVQQHERVVLLAANYVDGRCRNLHFKCPDIPLSD